MASGQDISLTGCWCERATVLRDDRVWAVTKEQLGGATVEYESKKMGFDTTSQGLYTLTPS